MKKLISLLVAIVMVMGLATVAFAETPEALNYTSLEEIPESVTLAAGQAMNINLMDAQALAGGSMTVTGNGEGMIDGWPQIDLVEDDGVYSAKLDITFMMVMRGFNTTIINTGSAEATYSVTFVTAPGTAGNPDPIEAGEGIAFMGDAYATVPYTYYYKYTAGETPEIVTISNIEITYGDTENITPSVALNSDNSDAVMEDGVATIGLYAGETVVITMTMIESDEETSVGMVEATFDLSAAEAPLGVEVNPIEITALGEYEGSAAAGSEVYYAVNSMLSGSIVTVEGVDYIIVGEDKIEATDGVATAILDAQAAAIKLAVGNESDDVAAYTLTLKPAPIAINAAGEFKAEVGAEGEIEYAVNSKLAGAILTVKGENAYVIVGDTKVSAVDGVISVVLDGEGAVIPVVIGNTGKDAASFEAEIAYAPTAINIGGDYKVTVGPKAEVEYAVNSKLDGTTVTVKGKDAYLIVNGKKIEGKDGVVTAVLEAKGATISLIVGNAGAESVEYAMNIAVAGNPQTGDFGVIAAAVAMGISAIGGTALISKKKEF